MEYRTINPEVLYTTHPKVGVTADDISRMKHLAAQNPRRRIRLCAHPDPADHLHEMLIVHPDQVYVRPHLHMGRSESFHVIEGQGEVVVFDDQGHISDLFLLGEPGSGRCFYFRLGTPQYHTLIVTSKWFVFQETTGGPFQPENTRWASWAPPEDDVPAVLDYLSDLNQKITLFKNHANVHGG